MRDANAAKAAHAIAQRHASASGTVARGMDISGPQVTVAVDDASRINIERLERDLRDVLGPDTTVTLEDSRCSGQFQVFEIDVAMGTE